MDQFDVLERSTCLRINAYARHSGIRNLFSAVSRLGDYPAWVIFGLVCAANPGVPARQVLLQAGLTGLVGVLVYKVLKERLVRERPFIRFGDIVCGTAPLDRYSFPSGHTLHAVSFTLLFGSYAPQLLWVLVPFALLVALSRVVLGLHYPSDVAAGGLVGSALATASLALGARLLPPL
jgi:undecaprenyl-diphosphatase